MLSSFIMSKTTADELLFKVMASSTVKFNFSKAFAKANQFLSFITKLHCVHPILFFTASQAFKTGRSFINGILEFVHSLIFWLFLLFLTLLSLNTVSVMTFCYIWLLLAEF